MKYGYTVKWDICNIVPHPSSKFKSWTTLLTLSKDKNSILSVTTLIFKKKHIDGSYPSFFKIESWN